MPYSPHATGDCLPCKLCSLSLRMSALPSGTGQTKLLPSSLWLEAKRSFGNTAVKNIKFFDEYLYFILIFNNHDFLMPVKIIPKTGIEFTRHSSIRNGIIYGNTSFPDLACSDASKDI